MKNSVKEMYEIEISYLMLFVVTFVLTIIVIFFQQSELLLHSQMLSKSSLGLIHYQESDSKSLFLYIFKERFWVIPLMFLLATTHLAKVTGYGLVLWYGAGIGAVTGIAMIRYGFVGILLIAISGLPQYLLYVPAFIVTLGLTRRRCEVNNRFYMQFFLLETVVIIGCALECYVNPKLVEKIIQIFIGA